MTSTRYIALLGAVNVGRQQMQMSRLRDLVTGLGHERVGTHIQTGNLFFTVPDVAAHDAANVKQELEQAIIGEFGFTVDSALFTVDTFAAILDDAPVRDRPLGPTERNLILYLLRPATPPALPLVSPNGSFAIVGAGPDAWYVHINDAATWARTSATQLRRMVGNVASTGRWQHTSEKILEAARSL